LLAIVALAINSVKGYGCACNYLSVRTGVELKEATMSAARFKQVADSAQIDRAVAALNKHGFSAKAVANGAAAKDAVLYLWTVAPRLAAGLRVMEAWGFDYKTCAVWDKEKVGMGYWWRGQHEILMVGTRGKFSPPPQALRHERRGPPQAPDCKASSSAPTMTSGRRAILA
jgi:hypothetical protein